MGLIAHISTGNETFNCKSNIHEGKKKLSHAQRFMFISNTKPNHWQHCCVFLFSLYFLSIHGCFVCMSCACTCMLVYVEAASQPWSLFLKCRPPCVLLTQGLFIGLKLID